MLIYMLIIQLRSLIMIYYHLKNRLYDLWLLNIYHIVKVSLRVSLILILKHQIWSLIGFHSHYSLDYWPENLLFLSSSIDYIMKNWLSMQGIKEKAFFKVVLPCIIYIVRSSFFFITRKNLFFLKHTSWC